MELISIDDVRAAADDIAGTVVRTPLLPAPWDGELWLKPESLQPVGSFKLRGATHAVARLDPATRARGVVTHSSGNHGQALAYAARAAGVPCTVVVPAGAPPVKVDRIRALGAEVRLVPPARRLAEAERIAADTGAALVPPFDDRRVIAGQGTIGLEIVADLPDVDVVLVPVGGGGLASGVATAVPALRPSALVIGVEPLLAADAKESLAAGEVVVWDVERTYRTSADGLRTHLSALTLAHLRDRLDGIVTVTEEEILAATGRLVRDARLVAEPSGAVALAARLSHRDELPAGRTVAVVTGGNVDPARLASVLA
ncbi:MULTISPECIES: threonine/serine dehydratase [Micromonospora]|uniref:Threonine/serine dehydratase n=1 Tax=Micromonospora sicca TaxID=2202420 RepID=A0ABU5JLN1_9ACTN|nr:MULTISPECIES: threonine/serine dehydratase [unclassified Micromonospora]MBM0226769.1 threonine/serine dehydratase [Micromonospora sp. ATA51]MDZ5446805.1 threonine/serine dehydratase [Micromonospora sp. 4G57]MDZ5493540.1 threonine/serine dehydratase [Micromonospora sp. 4G53]